MVTTKLTGLKNHNNSLLLSNFGIDNLYDVSNSSFKTMELTTIVIQQMIKMLQILGLLHHLETYL